MAHKNLKTVAGCLTRVTCNITAPEGADTALSAYLVYEGESRPATMESAGVIIFPAVPYGHYAYEIRCGGKPVAFGHLLVRPSAFPHTDGVVDFELTADLTTTDAAMVELNLTPGPRGPQGEQGPQGETGPTGPQGPQGAALTYVDLTAEQKAELVAPLEYEEVEESARTLTGTTSGAFKWAQVCLNHEPALTGELRRVTIPCRTTASTEMTTAPRYLTLWEEQEDGSWVRLADSANAVAQTVGAESVWEFAPGVLLTPGRKLRVGLLSYPGEAWSAVSSSVIGAMGVVDATDASCYVENTSGEHQRFGVDMTFTVCQRVARFAPATHATDTTAHITPAEREAWNAAAESGVTMVVADDNTDYYDLSRFLNGGVAGFGEECAVNGELKQIVYTGVSRSTWNFPSYLHRAMFVSYDADGAELARVEGVAELSAAGLTVTPAGVLPVVAGGRWVWWLMMEADGETYYGGIELANVLLSTARRSTGGDWCVQESNMGNIVSKNALTEVVIDFRYLRIVTIERAGALVSTQRQLKEHSGDTTAHITPAEREAWNAAASAEPEYSTWLIVADERYKSKITPVWTLGYNGTVIVQQTETDVAFIYKGSDSSAPGVGNVYICGLVYLLPDGGSTGKGTTAGMKEWLISQWGDLEPDVYGMFNLVPMG